MSVPLLNCQFYPTVSRCCFGPKENYNSKTIPDCQVDASFDNYYVHPIYFTLRKVIYV